MTAITPTANLVDATNDVAGIIPIEVFYSECGTRALAHYWDRGKDYFISFLEVDRDVHTSSLIVHHESDWEGWHTGWGA